MLPSQKLAEYIKDRSVVIVGFGREGRSTLNFIRKNLPDKRVAVRDGADVSVDDPNSDLVTGESWLDGLDRFDLIIKSPGVAFLEDVYTGGAEVTCQLDLFLRFRSCRVLGVTGTKGKTTTTTLAFRLLTAAGAKATLCGNMGIPVLDYIDLPASEIAVIEMSSHQLEFTRSSPDAAVVTNIYEEHLDHYIGGFDGYVGAKLNIALHQHETGTLIYDEDSNLTSYPAFFGGKGKKTGVRAEDLPDIIKEAVDGNAHLRGKGMADVAMARGAALALVPDAKDGDLARAVPAFEGIAHRLEYVGRYGDIDWYDDAIATIPAATMVAVGAVPNIHTLILGGLDRGIDYAGLAAFLAGSGVKLALCMPETGEKIAEMLADLGAGEKAKLTPTLEEAVDAAFELTPRGQAVVLSPAAASYNAFRNFEEKGNRYKELVKGHG